MHDDVPMWTYWSLQEGTPGVEPEFQLTNAGEMLPVIHVDTDAPLISDVDGSVISDERASITAQCSFRRHSGRRVPYVVETPVDQVAVDPWASLPDCCRRQFCPHKVFRPGTWPKALRVRQVSIGTNRCFKPDSFPIFDVFREIASSSPIESRL